MDSVNNIEQVIHLFRKSNWEQKPICIEKDMESFSSVIGAKANLICASFHANCDPVLCYLLHSRDGENVAREHAMLGPCAELYKSDDYNLDNG